MNAPNLPVPYQDEPAPKSWVGNVHNKNIPPEEFAALYAADTRTTEEIYAEVTRSQLQQRGFTEQQADWWISEAKVRYCTMQETLTRFGVRTNSQGDRAEGLLIPYFDADGKLVMDGGSPFERVRVLKFDGGGKYRSEHDTVPHAYLPPLPHGEKWRDVFKDTNQMIAITEGEFKAGASTMSLGGIPTIGLGGVDCFVTRHGRVPELKGIHLKGRTVFVVFDAPMTKRVRQGALKAMNHLVAYGAKVKVVSIESTPVYLALTEGFGDSDDDEKPKMGIDDYLKAGGDWGGLMKPEVTIDLLNAEDSDLDAEIERSLTLLHEIAIVKGVAQPSYVHLEGPDIGMLRRARAMMEVYAPRTVKIPTRNGFTAKPMFDIWLTNKRRIELQEVVVRPDLPPLSITPDNNWNSWRGLATVPVRNDSLAKVFNDFVHDFFEHEVEDAETVALHRKKFVQWLADLFQNPGVRPHTSWTLISKDEGIGKSVLLELPAFIIGTGLGSEGAFIADAENLDTEWTSFYNGKIYIVFNEPSNNNSKMRQKAKNLRTNAYLDCNTKYGAHFRIPNILAFGFTTNEPYAFGISETARRDWVWEPKWKQTDRAWMQRAADFGRLACGQGPDSDAFRSAVLWELLFNVDLSDYDPKAPAGNSKAKTRAAGNSTSSTDLRKSSLHTRIMEILATEKAVAWTTDTWATWADEDFSKAHEKTDKSWLAGEFTKAGWHSKSTTFKTGKITPRIWFASREAWGDLSSEEKRRAHAIGSGENVDELVGADYAINGPKPEIG